MRVLDTKLSNVLQIFPDIHEDDRGFFQEFYNKDRYDFLADDISFVQDNCSLSKYNTLRGLHFQVTKPQGKLVSCIFGSVIDVVVDIDPSSETYGEYLAIELSESNKAQLWIPPGHAHGFYVNSSSALFFYKCTDLYDPKDESGIIWNDQDLNISWPSMNPSISQKDSAWQTFKEYDNNKDKL